MIVCNNYCLWLIALQGYAAYGVYWFHHMTIFLLNSFVLNVPNKNAKIMHYVIASILTILVHAIGLAFLWHVYHVETTYATLACIISVMILSAKAVNLLLQLFSEYITNKVNQTSHNESLIVGLIVVYSWPYCYKYGETIMLCVMIAHACWYLLELMLFQVLRFNVSSEKKYKYQLLCLSGSIPVSCALISQFLL